MRKLMVVLVVVASLILGQVLVPGCAVAAEASAAADPAALREQAQTAQAAGDWAAAVEAFEALVAVAPEDGQAWLGLGRSRHQAGDVRGALAAYERAVEIGGPNGGPPPPGAFFHGARAWMALGEPTQAVAWLSRLADAGFAGYRAVVGNADFAPLLENADFKAVIERMRPCRSPEHRQFDFWLGEWEVTSPTGQAQGSNSITSIQDGCALREQWTSASGNIGTSLNFYDAAKGVWHQTWIDDSGNALYLDGRLVAGAMVLSSDPESSPIQRITWTPLTGEQQGKVRQLWESSTDGGASWSVAFEGIYAPR
jgi:tetratricopeptide (TPR) repeat protein